MPYDPKASLLAKVNAMEALAKSGAPVNPVDPAYNQWRPDFKATPVQSVQAPVQPMAQSQSSSQAPASDDPNARLQAYLAQSGQQAKPKTALGMVGSAFGTIGRGLADMALQPARFVEQAGKGLGIKALEISKGRKLSEEEVNKINSYGGPGLQESVANAVAPSVASQYNTDSYKTIGEAAGGAIQAAANLATPFVGGGVAKNVIQGMALSGGSSLERGDSAGDVLKNTAIGGTVSGVLAKGSQMVGDKSGKANIADDMSSAVSRAAKTYGIDDASNAVSKAGKVTSSASVVSPVIAKAEKVANRRGIDERATQLIAESASNPSELRLLQKMQSIAEQASETLTPSKRPEEVIGAVINKNASRLLSNRKSAGKALDVAFKNIPSKPIDITPQAQRFVSELQSLEIKVTPGGKLDFRGSAFGGPSGGKTRALFEDAYRDIAPNAKGQSIRMPARLRATRQKLFRALDLDKTGEAFTSQDKALVERLRGWLDEPLQQASPKYAKASRQYATISDVLGEFYNLIGKKFTDADETILNMRSGELANRLLSNSPANIERVLNALDEALPASVRSKSPNLKRLVAFGQLMQDVYKITPLTSLQGRLERGAANTLEGIDLASKLVRKDAAGIVETAAKKALGITPEKQQKAISDLIDAYQGITSETANDIFNKSVEKIYKLKVPLAAKLKMLESIPDFAGIFGGIAGGSQGVETQQQEPQSPQVPQDGTQDPNERLMKEIERLKAAQ
jgi:hypothetical protein